MQEKEMHISLFEHLLDRYGDEITVLLKRQYRMHEAIAEFPNVMFYEGQLETADQNRDWLIDDLKPLMGINISGGEQQREGSRSYYNAAEAEAVAKQIKLFTNSGLDPADIGVISAYKDQIQFIEKELSGMEIENLDEITVDTVDSFQGGEREAIIVSFVRSNNRGNSGFLDLPDVGPRRLNVALTRARKRLVVVGDWGTLDATASHKSENDSCASLYADLAEYIRSLNWMLEQ
jgi:superfamily I DNA and/or RNA helicase